MYIKSVELLDDYRNLKKGLKIEFRTHNFLVGEQGCGKSTLLQLLRDNNSDILKLDLTDDVIKNGIETFYFDTESMNPRISNIDDYTTPSGESKGIGVGKFLMSHFMSHGEVMSKFTVDRLKDAKDCVLFLDEPESALSLRNQNRLAMEIFELYNRNVQCFVATHCLPLIRSYPFVYSLEHLKWMTSKSFIELSEKI